MRSAPLLLILRLARRDLRGSLKGFRVFVACLILGVAAIAAVGSVSAGIKAGLRADARSLVGGDIELRLIQRTPTPEERAWLESRAEVSRVAEMRAMARGEDGLRTLVELKAVDAAYPLYGVMTLEPAQPLGAALERREGRWGAVVDPLLLDRLKLKPGDAMTIGEATFTIRGLIAREPDRVGDIFSLGPRVMVAEGGLAETGLVQPGSLIRHEIRLKLPPDAGVESFAQDLERAFPEAGWRVRDIREAAPRVQRFLDRLTLFLTLVGLTALLVGGIGVANGVKAYLDGKTATIAMLKCLGAPSRLIFRMYFAQVLLMAVAGIAAGLALGALAPAVVAGLFPDLLPVAVRTGVYPEPLAMAALFGALTTIVFALWPLARAREVPAARLFRDIVAPVRVWPRPVYLAAMAACGLALSALIILSAGPNRRFAVWFVLGSIGTMLAFRAAAALITRAAEVLGRVERERGRARHPGWRLALANLYRPGAPTASVVLSLGLGLTVLVAVALIQANLSRQVTESLPETAPSYFFIDIQPDQVETFDRIVAGVPGAGDLARVPSLRGRITKLDGVPVEQVAVDPAVAWVVQGDRGLTYAAEPPEGSEIVAGRWWPKDYAGPLLVSFDAEAARGMGLKVGDTVTINVLGREITAEIANLRRIRWTTLSINFVMVFSPGTLEAAPHTWIATARATPQAEPELLRAVTDALPNVSAIRIRDALDSVNAMLGNVNSALAATAGVTLLSGALVLAGAVAAGRRRRVYEAVVLKVLGATRRDVLKTFLYEYGLLGAATGIVAAVVGTVCGWVVLTQVMGAEWTFLPSVVAVTVVGCALLTIAVGFVGTWRALGQKAAPLLRHD